MVQHCREREPRVEGRIEFVQIMYHPSLEEGQQVQSFILMNMGLKARVVNNSLILLNMGLVATPV